MEYCSNGKYNKRLVMIGTAYIELEKYLDTNDHNTDLHNLLHLGSLPQTAGWIDWLQLVRRETGAQHDGVPNCGLW